VFSPKLLHISAPENRLKMGLRKFNVANTFVLASFLGLVGWVKAGSALKKLMEDDVPLLRIRGCGEHSGLNFLSFRGRPRFFLDDKANNCGSA
jgi:hypothetical protein